MARKWEQELGDDSESEVEGGDQEEDATPETTEMKLLRSVLGSISRPKPFLSTYDGNFSAEGLIDQIGELRSILLLWRDRGGQEVKTNCD